MADNFFGETGNDFTNDVLPMDSSGFDFLKSGNIPSSGGDFGYGQSAGGDNSFDFLQAPKFNQGIVGQLGGYGAVLPTAMTGLGTLFSMRDASRNRAALQDLANQQQFYNSKLQQSYNDPNAYLNSPEGRALRSQTAQAVARKAAAQGMRGQTGAQMNLVNQAMMDNLGKYRAGLEKAYKPDVAAALQNAIAQRSKMGQLSAGLDKLFNNPQTMGVISKAIPMVGGALGGLGGAIGNAVGGLGGLFGGSDSGPSIDIGSLAPSTYEFI